MKCKNCPHYDNNHTIQIIDTNHPTYYEQGVYCTLTNESQLTKEDLKIKCPLGDD